MQTLLAYNKHTDALGVMEELVDIEREAHEIVETIHRAQREEGSGTVTPTTLSPTQVKYKLNRFVR